MLHRFTRTSRALRQAACVTLLIGGALSGGASRALDNDADVYAAGATPAGTNLAPVYYQYAERDKVRANGNTVAKGSLRLDVAILRFVRFVDIFGYRADPQVLIPLGKLKASDEIASLGSCDGLAEPIVAATTWLENKPAEGEFFGITPGIYVPLGGYDKNRALNLGENRWKYLLQTGWTTPLGNSGLSLQLSGDVTLFGKNDEFGPNSQTLKQKPLYQLQAWLMHPIDPSFDVRIGTSHFTGGRTEVDGVENDDWTKTTNLKLGFAWGFAPGWNFLALYGRDLSVHNGPAGIQSAEFPVAEGLLKRDTGEFQKGRRDMRKLIEPGFG